MQFWQLCQIYFARNLKHSCSEPKKRKVLFLPEICTIECSTGRVECLTEEPGVFLQIRISSEKPSKDIKLYLRPKTFHQKVPLVTRTLFLTPLSKTSATNLEFLHSKSEKNAKLVYLLEKKPFVSKLFSGHIEWGVDNTAKNLSPTNQPFFAHCP